ncbi:MAG TPA: heparan-alpha-glucosaminide N-acetyltransferase [Albitalea sp.]|nr:heparan-alpha-glucosaminide N-acetyltransferase [Albitalea sp.]HUG24485.1 heparan-alpha-glucosaminide N-acetyltransferase [Albitalea sp.]
MSAATQRPERFDRLDAVRGFATVWMAVYHFFFDLDHFRFIAQDFHSDPFWTLQRSAILSLFLLCAGFGQAVALQRDEGWPRFWRRWLQVAGGALLVTAGSWLMFPRSYISFGVLHAIAVMLIVMRLTAHWGRALWLAGAVALLLPHFVQHPFFDSRLTNWVGLVTRKPITEDYVPLLPWLGVMWWGLAAGQSVLAQRPALVAGALPSALHPLAILARWSLSFYLLHQPVLIGALLAWVHLTS